jgi:hypothetical protein
LALIAHDNPGVGENRYRTVVIVLLIAVMLARPQNAIKT